MIDFFEPHIAAELENNAAEFSSVQVRFTNECRSEVCLDTSAHMAYEFTVSGGDVVDLIDSSRSVSLYFEPKNFCCQGTVFMKFKMPKIVKNNTFFSSMTHM